MSKIFASVAFVVGVLMIYLLLKMLAPAIADVLFEMKQFFRGLFA